MLLPMKTYIISGLTLASVLAPQLHSETYNIITVSRSVIGGDSYPVLEQKAVENVFQEISKAFSGDTGTGDTKTEEHNNKEDHKIDGKHKTLILFNEGFFGLDSTPLSQDNVSMVIEKGYKAFHKNCPNSYFFINFVYESEYNEKERKDEVLKKQIEISRKRYKDICDSKYEAESLITNQDSEEEEDIKEDKRSFSSFFGKNLWFYKNGECGQFSENMEEYLKEGKNEPADKAKILFNQTKIFYDGKEIGHYNKSSFADDVKDLHKYYYVIGDFKTYWEKDAPILPVRCLICYDALMITQNELCTQYNDTSATHKITMFASNPYYTLPTDIKTSHQNPKDQYYVCANGDTFSDEEDKKERNKTETEVLDFLKTVNETKEIKPEDVADFKYDICLNGIFEYKDKSWITENKNINKKREDLFTLVHQKKDIAENNPEKDEADNKIQDESKIVKDQCEIKIFELKLQ